MDEHRKRAILRRGIDHFNRREFFECHEVLEEVWLAEEPQEKPFYQGLIQAASAFHHYQRGNLRGARSLLRRGAEKLKGYPAVYLGVAVSGLLEDLRSWMRHWEEAGAPRPAGLPTIRCE